MTMSWLRRPGRCLAQQVGCEPEQEDGRKQDSGDHCADPEKAGPGELFTDLRELFPGHLPAFRCECLVY